MVSCFAEVQSKPAAMPHVLAVEFRFTGLLFYDHQAGGRSRAGVIGSIPAAQLVSCRPSLIPFLEATWVREI
jgi:hypothetical protein